ncbi:hypothetical protein Scep_020313 [Stephania cephalantha]|uniref:Protein CHROMATIN REMODELING 25 n=1 Tax=Stephania cephalantha TaxID=152367 RepID=A0AAP0NNW0_9MAGN
MAMEEEEDELSSTSSPSEDSSDEYDIAEDAAADEQDDAGDQSPDHADSTPSDEDRKSRNVDALVRGNLVVKRQSLIPRVLSVSDGAVVARKPFKPPCSNGYGEKKEELVRRLWARKRFVPWGSSRPVLVEISNRLNVPNGVGKVDSEESEPLPPGIEPLVLWQPDESGELSGDSKAIVVDPLLVRFLRPHQREGVQFMFDCVSGLINSDVSGCILADDMGLGKTLQSITLMYTLLRQGFDGKPMVKKAIIVTPTSLVSNWESEISKWVGSRVGVVALCESTRDDVVSGIDNYLRPHSPFQVLIVSYETFRMHSAKFDKCGSCDILICDEAHRLKNDQTLTNKALATLSCNRRILLSGTPMQNDLEEFFAMVNFTNPGFLGDAAFFRRYYEAPIICGREPTATEAEVELATERTAELSAKVNQFILRRTNALLSNHLPPKIVEVVCCKLTNLQSELYNHFIHSKNLIYDTIKSGSPGTSGFEDCLRFFPPEMSGSWTGGEGAWVELSGKMHTLDLFAQLCRERRYPYLRLDGTTSISKRQKLVNQFNDLSKDEFVFLLSSKAGGCGLNLIGGNRLVLFDPDWNPANDKQAAARVWRDGQKKRVFIYRFLSTGTIEEKVYQRQMSKEGLQKVIQREQSENHSAQGNFLSTEDLRDLFTFHENIRSEIHEKMNCTRCTECDSEVNNFDNSAEVEGVNSTNENCQVDPDDIGGFAKISGCLEKQRISEKQLGTPLEEDLRSWGHHSFSTSVPDAIFQASAGDEVTFVFTNQVDGKLIPIESTVSSRLPGVVDQQDNAVTKEIFQNKKLLIPKRLPQVNSSISSNRNSITLVTPATSSPSFQNRGMKLGRTSFGNSILPTKPRTCTNQLPLKRMSPYIEIDGDDDFV